MMATGAVRILDDAELYNTGTDCTIADCTLGPCHDRARP